MTTWTLRFLGTAASAFSKTRNPTSMLLQAGGRCMLLDCPDGTTRRLIDAGVDVDMIDTVFISHGHNDHLAGLTSLAWQNWLAADRRHPLEIVAPAYVHDRFDSLMELFSTPPGVLPYPVLRTVADSSLELVSRTFQAPLDGTDPRTTITFQHARGIHHPESHGYRVDVVHAGTRVSICYSGDTAPCPAIERLARGCDVLIHEATFLDTEVEKATAYNHATPSGAASIASAAGAGKLVLVHYSNTLEGRERELHDQAAAVFHGPVIVATDGLVLTG